MSTYIVVANGTPINIGAEKQPIANLNVLRDLFVEYPAKFVKDATEVYLRESVWPQGFRRKRRSCRVAVLGSEVGTTRIA